eukprot:2705526-Pyramimonas_sp.AAC.1
MEACERLALQGFPPSLALWMTGDVSLKAAGNAYAVPVVIAALCPLIQVLKTAISNGFDLQAWPSDLSHRVPDECNVLARALSARPKLAPKSKARGCKRARPSTA